MAKKNSSRVPLILTIVILLLAILSVLSLTVQTLSNKFPNKVDFTKGIVLDKTSYNQINKLAEEKNWEKINICNLESKDCVLLTPIK